MRTFTEYFAIVLAVFLVLVLLMACGCAGAPSTAPARIEIGKDGGATITPETPVSPPTYVRMGGVKYRRPSGPVIPWFDMLIVAGVAAGGAVAAGFWLKSANVVLCVLLVAAAIIVGMLFFATWLYVIVGGVIVGVVLWAFPSLIGSIKAGLGK